MNNMRCLHIIMPMAGEGSRFLREGWKTPKPLIKLHGKELFLRAIGSITIPDVPIKYSFIVRKEHIVKYNIDKEIKKILPDANIFFVEQTTRGAVETCLFAKNVIDRDDSIVVMDCDLEFRSTSYNEYIKKVLSSPIENVEGGILASFESSDPKYSYAEVDNNNNVIRTAEKNVISNHALCGSYFFSKSDSFLKAAEMMLKSDKHESKEFYVSLLFNSLLNNGEKVKLATMEKYYSYGTPEELMKFM